MSIAYNRTLNRGLKMMPGGSTSTDSMTTSDPVIIRSSVTPNL